MPKKPFTIKKFKGLQTYIDSADAEPTSLSEANGVFLSKPGVISLARRMVQYHSLAHSFLKLKDGYGLFQFSTDYTWNGSASRTNNLLIVNGNEIIVWEGYDQLIPVIQTEDSNSNPLELSSTSYQGTHGVVTVIDGILRISDGRFSNIDTKTKWLGYIKRTQLSGASTYENAIDGWRIADAEIIAPLSLFLPPPGSLDISIETVTNGGSWSACYLALCYSYIYDDIQESPLSSNSESAHVLDDDALNITIQAVGPFPDRVSGMRVYYKAPAAITDTLDMPWNILFEINLEKGVRVLGGSWNEWSDNTTDECAEAKIIGLTDPPIGAFDIFAGYSNEEPLITPKYATACVANRRLYIGNVYYDGQYYGDRMLRSEVNKFDTFLKDSFVDVVVGDGDEIIKLIAIDGKILQFKRNKLYVINVASNYETLDATYDLYGIEFPYQVIRIPEGAVWCNKFGVYIYSDGKITELSARIKETWKTFYSATSANPSIGYDGNSQKIIIGQYVRGDDIIDTSNALVFDLSNGEWTCVSDMFTDLSEEQVRTNMITAYDGSLLLLENLGAKEDSLVYTLADEMPIGITYPFSITTHDLVINDRAIKKRFYEVIFTFYTTASIVLECSVYIDGDTSPVETTNISLTGTGLYTKKVLIDPIVSGYSIKVKIASNGNSTTTNNFEIRRFSIVYRDIGVR